MGLLSSSVSFVRYSVEGEIPPDFINLADERIKAHAFRDIDESFEETSIGWVSVMNMFDTEFAFASFAVGDYIVMTLRIDERKVSAAAVKKFTLKEEERIKKERQVPRLSRSHLLEIKENVKLQLMKKAVPLPSVYDVCWNLAQGTLLFFSTSLKAQELLENFFKETFGLDLVLQIPYLTAQHLLGQEDQEALADITPEIFV